MKFNNTEKREIAIPEGIHKAVVYSEVDLGTQITEFGEKRKVLISWEISSIRKTFSQEKGEQPVAISKKFTASMHEKSSLRPVVEAVMGRKFESDEEAYDFDTKDLIGKTCLIYVEHNDGYANIKNVMKNTDGVDLVPENPTRIFELDNPDRTVFDSLHDKLKVQVSASPEYALAKKI